MFGLNQNAETQLRLGKISEINTKLFKQNIEHAWTVTEILSEECEVFIII